MTTKPSAMTENIVKLPKSAKDSSQRAAQGAVDFVRDHPGLVVAGGLAVGLVAGALLSRGSGRKLAKHAVTLAEIAGSAGLAFGRDALGRAEEAGSELRKQGEALGEKASKLAGPAEDAMESAQDAATRLLRKAIDLAGKLRS